jgi:hypothetical protein
MPGPTPGYTPTGYTRDIADACGHRLKMCDSTRAFSCRWTKLKK